MKMGLMVNVFRHSDMDCTNHGVTSTHDNFVLVGSAPVFEVRDDRPGLYLMKYRGRVIACPEDLVLSDRRARGELEVTGLHGWMFGGNFVYTSDSRFPSDAPIHVYDRKEL